MQVDVTSRHDRKGAGEERTARPLRYYISLAAPPTRAPFRGDEAFLRPEVGFNPSWFHYHCGIDFSERWHQDPEYRLAAWEKMAKHVRQRFPGRAIGGVDEEGPPDLLTAVFGVAVVPALFGQEILYFCDKWPVPRGPVLTDDQADRLKPVKPEANRFFAQIMDQLDRIERLTGDVRGFLNWQGVLNVAFRLRGQQIFIDMIDDPGRANHIFECIAETIIAGVKYLHIRQARSGRHYHFATISNCVVNMVSPDQYEAQLLPHDQRIRSEFRDFGIHNCAWTVDPYLSAYARIPGVGYLDMGINSNLKRARQLFPAARRCLLYTCMDLKTRSEEAIKSDLEKIANELGPCDLGLPDLEFDTPDNRIKWVMDLCEELSDRLGASNLFCQAMERRR